MYVCMNRFPSLARKRSCNSTFKALISVIHGCKNLDLIFGWSIKFRVTVFVGDKNVGLQFWVGVKISGI